MSDFWEAVFTMLIPILLWVVVAMVIYYQPTVDVVMGWAR